MKKKTVWGAMALLAAVCVVAYAVDMKPASHRGAGLGESGQAWGDAYVGAIIVAATGGTNTITTSAGLIDATKVTGKVTGTELALSATQWFDIVNTTQLVFIAAGVTNVIDADITTP